jgi:DNA polymerase III alpha subunit
MLKHFGIRTVTCKFRDDNRDFFVNYEDRTMSDALSSMKGVSASVANTLYNARNKQFNTFVDVLHWMHMETRINSGVQKTLIKTDYFIEFGDRRKLMMIYDEFYEGESKFSKQHVEATQERRLEELRQKEFSIKCLKLEKEGIIDVAEQLRYEANVLGRPLSVYDGHGALYTAISVNDRPRTPIYALYSAKTGVVGQARIPKGLMKKRPIQKGDTIIMHGYKNKDGGRFVDGRFRKDGTKELWVESYTLIEDGGDKE